jgi:glycosyltransferase involved in cell wall biosynthesis
MSRIAIYNLYWGTYGGAEQVSGAIAEHLRNGHDVTLLGPEPVDAAVAMDRLGVDVSGCGFAEVKNDRDASEASAEFDVFVNGTYRSEAVCRASTGIYYVHFPQPLPTSRQKRSESVARLARTAMVRIDDSESNSSKLARIKRGFGRRLTDHSWVSSYSQFLANSFYTAKWTQQIWGVTGRVAFPPVRPVVAADWNRKTATISSVGRFFDPIHGHCKKQLDLLEGFTRMHDLGRTKDHGSQWGLTFVGGADAANRNYTLAVKKAARGYPVAVCINQPRSLVEDVLLQSSIYWHGSGFGEDESTHPERFEHFGIAVVEAMAAGAVPVVFGAAGPAEIVRHGVDGFHWHSLEDLARHTHTLMTDDDRRRAMAESAVARAGEFSLDRFRTALDASLRF